MKKKKWWKKFLTKNWSHIYLLSRESPWPRSFTALLLLTFSHWWAWDNSMLSGTSMKSAWGRWPFLRSGAIRSWILLSLYRFRRRVLIREEKWHRLTLLLYLCGYLPQRSPFKQSPNAVFVSVVRCYEISVWSSMSDRESLAWGKRFNIMWTFVLFTSATFISVCELLSCFFPTAKFKTFALVHIPLEPQIRCKMGMLIISSPRQQRSCKQHSCFFQVTFF